MADARLAVAIVLDRPRRREACGHDGLIKSSAIGAGGRYWHRSWPAQEHADPISALRQFLQEMSPNEAGGSASASSIQSTVDFIEFAFANSRNARSALGDSD
jgi:hypothetical protein